MRVIPAPYRILALVLLVGACIAFGYVQGVSREADRRDAQDLERVRAEIKAADKESTRKEAVGAKREVARERIRVVYHTIKEEVVKYVEKNADVNAGCGLDADGLRIWNAANRGSAEAVSGEPDSALPGGGAGAVGEVERLAAKPRRRDGVGAAVPRPAGEAGGM